MQVSRRDATRSVDACGVAKHRTDLLERRSRHVLAESCAQRALSNADAAHYVRHVAKHAMQRRRVSRARLRHGAPRLHVADQSKDDLRNEIDQFPLLETAPARTQPACWPSRQCEHRRRPRSSALRPHMRTQDDQNTHNTCTHGMRRPVARLAMR